jgi:hypothetical protein
MSMRVDVISTTVTRRLQASAAIACPAADGSAVMRVPSPAVEDPDRDVGGHRGENRAGMEDLGAEVRQLRRLRKRQPRDDGGMVHHSRIRREHAVDIGPDLDLAAFEPAAGWTREAVQRGTHQRTGIVRPSPSERRRRAGRGAADEAAKHRHAAGEQMRH